MLVNLKGRVFYFCLLVCTLLGSNLFALQRGPCFRLDENDKKDLGCFFSFLFTDTTAGYVLYGQKPVCVTGFKFIEEDPLSLDVQADYDIALTRGYNVLKDLKLSNKSYQICIEDSLVNPDYKEIRLVNKKALLKAIKKNLSIFRSELDITYGPKKILDNILSSKSFEFLKGHTALKGIVLGYGTENSLAYERTNKLMVEAEREGVLDEILQSGKKIVDLEEEIKEVVIAYAKSDPEKWQSAVNDFKNFSYFDENDMKANFNVKIPFSYISGSKESKKLISNYIKTEKKVSKLLKNKYFVEKTLKKLD